MKQILKSAFGWLADMRLARSMAERLFRARARQRVQELDQVAPARAQSLVLLNLVRKGQSTSFGRDHDFARIRTSADFRRLVPLRTPADLWKEYWQPRHPALENATWPGPIPYLSVSSLPDPCESPYIPISPASRAQQQSAAMTALALAMHARPSVRLCQGNFCYLGNDARLEAVGPSEWRETQEALAVRELPVGVRPYALAPASRHASPSVEQEGFALQRLASRTIHQSVTCLAGTPSRLGQFLKHAKAQSGTSSIASLWPELSAVLVAGTDIEGTLGGWRANLEESGILVMQLLIQPEGALAVEDPRHSCLRLLPNVGSYFEFVPLAQLDSPRPDRLTVSEIAPGTRYAIAISSPAGFWACLTRYIVQFESLRPPLFRLVGFADLPKSIQRDPQAKRLVIARPL